MNVVTYYATANRRAPWVALHGYWPPRSGLTRSCMAGVRIIRRPMTEAELQQRNDPSRWRFSAERWLSLMDMMRSHRDYEHGDDGFPKALMDAIRAKREEIKRCLIKGRRKARKHEEQLARRR